MSIHTPRRSDAFWDHTGKLKVARLNDSEELLSVTLPDDLTSVRQRVDDLEARPIPPGRAFMIAATGPHTLNAGRVMSALAGWRLSTDGGLRGISVLDAGFLIEPGRAYILVLADLLEGQINQTGLTFQLQRSSLVHGQFDRPAMLSSPSSYQTMWPYLADQRPNDVLVVNVANTNSQYSFSLTNLRAVWVEIA